MRISNIIMNTYCLPVYKQLKPPKGSNKLRIVPAMFLLHGRDSKWPSADWSACSVSPRLCWTGLTAWRGEKLQLVSFVPKLQRGSRSLPRLFQLRASIYQHADLHIYHGSHCLARSQVAENERGREGRRERVREESSHEKSGLWGDGLGGLCPLASIVNVPCLKSCLYFQLYKTVLFLMEATQFMFFVPPSQI